MSLTDGSTTFGFISVNGRGEFDSNGVVRNPNQRTSLKLSSGSTTYSDFSEPFTPITQSDWSGGLGQEDFERDRTRFYSSRGINTWMSGRVISGPEETYSTGMRNSDTEQHPGGFAKLSLGDDDDGSIRFANSFSASATYSADKVYVPVFCLH